MKKVVFLCLTAAVVLLSACSNNEDTSDLGWSFSDETDEETSDNVSVDTSFQETVLTVYICGAVRDPGVYSLPEGSRICDAVSSAGGLTDDASDRIVNLAEMLEDGQMIVIPTLEEAAEAEANGVPSVSEGGSQNVSTTASEGLVNINSAGASELMTLPGIGETRSQAIISYRNAHGSFSDIRQITNVSGIGSSIFEQIRELITV